MPVSTTWKILKMERTVADGGVFLVYWELKAQNDDPEKNFVATDSGKLRCQPDPSSPDYVQYDDLTEDIVIGWVK